MLYNVTSLPLRFTIFEGMAITPQTFNAFNSFTFITLMFYWFYIANIRHFLKQPNFLEEIWGKIPILNDNNKIILRYFKRPFAVTNIIVGCGFVIV